MTEFEDLKVGSILARKDRTYPVTRRVMDPIWETPRAYYLRGLHGAKLGPYTPAWLKDNGFAVEKGR